MENTKYVLNFHLFDGEGGGEAGTASTPGSEQGSTTKEYGKPEGNGQANSQVGSDDGSQGSSLESEWASLIGKGGQFHDLYGHAVSEAIQQRFKNQADLQGQVDQITEGLSPLFLNYGLEAGDYEGLTNAIANDDAFYQAGAEKAGLDVETYKEMQRLRADAERNRKINENYERERQAQEVYQQWETDAEQLRQAVPNFDLGLEIEHNEAFADYLDKGLSVQDAFFLTHREGIVNGMNTAAQMQATTDVMNNIQKRTARPMESAMGAHPATERVIDPSKLSDDDLDEINRQVREEGKTFSF